MKADATVRYGALVVLVAIAIAVALLLSADGSQTAPEAERLVRFYVMGDVPYAPEENELLQRQISAIPQDAEFVVHVGDIKTGRTPCEAAVYERVAAILAESVAPLFIIPGDNEWNDCRDPDPAWDLWERHFLRFDQRWQHGFGLQRQPERAENFAFVRGGVLFLGINLVGGRVHDQEEWQLRLAQDLEWTRSNVRESGDLVSSVVLFGHARPESKHDRFFDGLERVAVDLGKQVLYLHGDGHRWIRDRPFGAKNILRVQVDQGGIAPPLQVTVTDDAEQPFVLDRRK